MGIGPYGAGPGYIAIVDITKGTFDGKSMNDFVRDAEREDITLEELVQIEGRLVTWVSLALNDTRFIRVHAQLLKKLGMA